MKRAIIVITAIAFVITMVGAVFAADMKKVDTKMLNWTAQTQIAKFGMDKTIVKAVWAQDKQMMTLSEIKDTDRVWRGVLGDNTLGIMDDMMSNDCAMAARKLMDAHPYVTEIFIYDNQGANVCETAKTSDYWQGDEAKFWNSYNGGIGSVFVDAVEEDGGKMISQVSVPVMKKGKAIGAMTVGVDVNKL